MTIYAHGNYREYIKERVIELRASHEGFSFRQFSAEAGFRSPNYLKLIMDGKRNLSIEGARKVANGLKLGIKESEYFELLVEANQTPDIQNRAELAERLLRLRAKHCKQEKPSVNYDYFRLWSNVVVREALLVNTEKPLEKISHAFVPKISENEIAESLAHLARIGLICKNAEGRWKPSEESVTTNDFFSSSAILSFYVKMMDLGKSALTEFRGNEREIGAVTVALSPRSFEKVRESIKALKEEVMALSEHDKHKQDVYQLNIQFFPLTRKLGNE